MMQFPGFSNVQVLHDNREARRHVFSAMHPTYGRVAIKVVGFASQNTLNLAERETVIGLKAQHPSICKVFCKRVEGLADESECNYMTIVMPYVASDLGKEISKRNKCDPKQYWGEASLWNILLQAVDALKYAQANNVCHRDIKPQNILIAETGQVYIADFGSGKTDTFLEQGKKHTLTGTLAYFSPEMQANFTSYISSGGSLFDYNPYKSDVFSLGLTFIHLMSLKRPENLACPDRLSMRIASVLDSLAARYSEELLTIIGAMLEERPELRPDFIELGYMVRAVRQEWNRYVSPVEGSYWKVTVAGTKGVNRVQGIVVPPGRKVVISPIAANADPRCPIELQSPRNWDVYESSATQLVCSSCKQRQGFVVTLSCKHCFCRLCTSQFGDSSVTCILDGQLLTVEDERKLRIRF